MPNRIDMLQEMMGCPPPVWMNTSDARLDDGRCVVFSGDSRCKNASTHLAWIGCAVGEHLDKSAVCGYHASRMRSVKGLHCLRCWDKLRIISEASTIKIELKEDGQ